MNTFFSKLKSDRSTSNVIGREKVLFGNHNFLFVCFPLLNKEEAFSSVAEINLFFSTVSSLRSNKCLAVAAFFDS